MPDFSPIVSALSLVEECLREPLLVAEMADVANYSVYHFCRQFRRYVHHSPYDYLMRRRLTEAADLILNSDHRITDIAFEFNFNNLEVFSRAFYRWFGILPSEARRENTIESTRLLPPITQEKLEHMFSCMDSLVSEYQEMNTRILTGLSAPFSESNRLFSVYEASKPTMKFTLETGGLFTWQSSMAEADTWFFWGAFREQTDKKEPNFFSSIEIPKGEYAVFDHFAEIYQLKLSLEWILHTWLPYSGFNLAWHGVLILQVSNQKYQICLPVKKFGTELENHPY